MHIAYVQPSMDFLGGSQITGYDESQETIRQGHECTLITTKYNEKYYPNRKFNLREVGCNTLLDNTIGKFLPIMEFKSMAVLNRINKAIKEVKADVVVTKLFPFSWITNKKNMHWYCDDPSFALYSKLVNPIEASVNPTCGFAKPWIKKFLQRIDKRLMKNIKNPIISNSKRTAFLLKKLYGREDTVIIHPGMPLHRYDDIKVDYAKIREKFGIDKSKTNFLIISRLHRYKNIIMALKAFKLIQEKNENTELIIAGRGPRLDYLKLFSKHHDLNVKFTGYISHEDKLGLLHESDIFLFPSLYEALGLTIVEAMFFKKPVVALNEWGPTETVVHNKTGFLVNNNVYEFSRAMECLMNNPKLCKRMGVAGRRRAEKEFTIKKLVSDLIKHFKKFQ